MGVVFLSKHIMTEMTFKEMQKKVKRAKIFSSQGKCFDNSEICNAAIINDSASDYLSEINLKEIVSILRHPEKIQIIDLNSVDISNVSVGTMVKIEIDGFTDEICILGELDAKLLGLWNDKTIYTSSNELVKGILGKDVGKTIKCKIGNEERKVEIISISKISESMVTLETIIGPIDVKKPESFIVGSIARQ